jgi:hypothetical protein
MTETSIDQPQYARNSGQSQGGLMLEEQAEIMALTDLATNLGDGLKALSASNIGRPIKTFGEDLPEQLADVEVFAERFVGWQVARLKDAALQAVWSHPDALADVMTYLRRKVWQSKIERGAVINPVARMLATTVSLHRKYRADVHEALNHAAKHNEDVKALGAELRDQLDEVVRARLEETTKAIAGAALATVPQLQRVLMQGALTHES